VTATHPGFVGARGAERRADPVTELVALVDDAARVGTIAFDLQAVLTAAYAVRDALCADAWRVVDGVRRRIERGRYIDADRLEPELDALVTDLAAAVALAQDGMLRDQAWLFLDTGRRLERALLVIALLRATVIERRDALVESRVLSAVLRATESALAYRRRHQAAPEIAAALALLLLDDTNPRSLGFQLDALHRNVRALSRDDARPQLADEERLVLDATTTLRVADLGALCRDGDGAGSRDQLDALLVRIAALLRQTSDVLTRHYFIDLRGPQHLAKIGAEAG
jgi:uncharacterized alpha-E superfamily protein